MRVTGTGLGTGGAIFETVLTGGAGDRATAMVYLKGLGPRGGVRARVLLVGANQARTLRRLAKDARGVVETGEPWHATMATGSGSFRVEKSRLADGAVWVSFMGRRRALKWREHFGPDGARQVLAALEAAAAHLSETN